MAGYSGRPLVQKPGIKPGFRIFASGAPAAYGGLVGKLPDGVVLVPRLCAPLDMVQVFATEAARLSKALPSCRDAIVPDGMVDLLAEEGQRCGDRPQRCRGSRYRAADRPRRHQGLRDRCHLVGPEIRHSEQPADGTWSSVEHDRPVPGATIGLTPTWRVALDSEHDMLQANQKRFEHGGRQRQ